MSEAYLEYLKFIRETGAEVKELNDKLHQKDEEIIKLHKEIANLKKQIGKQEEEMDRISDVNQYWHDEYRSVFKDKCDMEQKLDIMVNAIEVLAPKLKEAIDKDLKEDEIFSDLLNNTKNKYRWCY